MQRFDNKIAVITGGASGIGAATARRLHSEGAKIVAIDINAELGSALVEELGPDTTEFIAADVSEWADVQRAVQAAVDRFGRIDVLFNNAGVGCYNEVTELDVDEWRRVIGIDLDSAFYFCKAAIPIMREHGGGAIINNASVAGLAGDYAWAGYNAAKGGLINLTKTLAIDHAKDNIRVNAVCPGPVSTPLFNGIKQVPGLEKIWTDTIPIQRFAEPEEIASVVAFLASDEASYMVGSIVTIDGGSSAHTGQPNMPAIIAAATGE